MSNLLLYFHGHQLVVDQGKNGLANLYVAAKYFGCENGLLEFIRGEIGAKSDGNAILKLDQLASLMRAPGFYRQHMPIGDVSQLPRSSF